MSDRIKRKDLKTQGYTNKQIRNAKRASILSGDNAYHGRTIPFNTAVDNIANNSYGKHQNTGMYTDEAGQKIYHQPKPRSFINAAADTFGLAKPMQQRAKVVDSLQNTNVRVIDPRGLSPELKRGGSVMKSKMLRNPKGSRRSL